VVVACNDQQEQLEVVVEALMRLKCLMNQHHLMVVVGVAPTKRWMNHSYPHELGGVGYVLLTRWNHSYPHELVVVVGLTQRRWNHSCPHELVVVVEQTKLLMNHSCPHELGVVVVEQTKLLMNHSYPHELGVVEQLKHARQTR
jgi:hypothetical protein